MYYQPYWNNEYLPNNQHYATESYFQHHYGGNSFTQCLATDHVSGVGPGYLPQGAKRQRTDFGPDPFVVNIEEATTRNNSFRRALWTGRHFQITLMSIGPGEDIGLEIHPHIDQFLRIEQGQGIVRMGKQRNQLNFQRRVADNFAIVVPAGTWHNVINTGREPLKLYSIYAPPQHPFGTIHRTKADAMAAEGHQR
ncbi:cupin domain-containing protein [Bacillus sp. FJAT-27251]|uniref:cupin domain-containing protein n=1 Tax=Bacillus sp. FJAT-27251 TaxID=1684142 RepID=UPI0009E65776|nr:cupin domain-containing protein [Bacillus sp. FJAT-27251]